MAKKSVLGNPSTISKVSKEGFNMNQVFTFTASTGMLLPTWFDFLNPGEKVSGFPSFLLRSDPFLAPAMVDLDCFVDVFFVPFNKIFSAFGEWFYQIDDLRSNFLDIQNFIDRLPIIGRSASSPVQPFTDFLTNEYNQFGSVASPQFDCQGFGMHRLMMHLGRNPQALFYGMAYADNDLALNNDDPSGVLAKYQPFAQNLSTPNYSPWLEACYQAIYMDYYRPDLYEANDINAYNMDAEFNDGTGKILMFNIPQWKHKGMFQLRYRCKSADYFVSSKPAPLFSSTGMFPNADVDLMSVNQWLTGGLNIQMEDYGGLNIDPRTTVGSAISGNTSTDQGRWNRNNNYTTFGGNAGDVFFSGSSKNFVVQNAGLLLHDHNISTVLNTSRLRTMFALEKLARITYRAGKHYDDQTLAHFGFKVPQGISGEVYHLKSYHTPMVLNRVVSTAGTSSTPLGEQAANGAAMLNGKENGNFSFVAPCHGVVMSIFSIAPRYKYIFTQDKFGFKNKLWDFFKPVIDNLGMQPLFGYEQSCQFNSTQTLYTNVDAWQWRFMEDKLKYDRVSVVFATPSKNPWSFCALAAGGNLISVLVPPTALNDLFNVQYDPSPSSPEGDSQSSIKSTIGSYPSVYLRDPFTIDFMMKASKASYMSTYGDTPISGI